MNFYNEISTPKERASDETIVLAQGRGHFRGERMASTFHRLVALLVDVGVAFGIWKLFDILIPESWRLLDGIADFIGFWLAFGFAAVNLVYLQSRTGQSLGKMLLGMVVVHPRVDPMNMERAFYVLPSLPMMIGRCAAHYFLDFAFFIGLLFMMKSPRRETLADRLCNTIVLRPRDINAVELHKGLDGARDR